MGGAEGGPRILGPSSIILYKIGHFGLPGREPFGTSGKKGTGNRGHGLKTSLLKAY